MTKFIAMGKSAYLIPVCCLVFFCCTKTTDQTNIQVNSISPTKAGIGMSVSIRGKFPGSNSSNTAVYFNGVVSLAGSFSDSMITAQVPDGATTGFITVILNGDSASGVLFTVLPGSWKQITDLPAPQGRVYGAGFSINGKGYVVGGTDNPVVYKDVMELDPVTKAWTQKTSSPGTGFVLPVNFVINNKAYIGICQIDGGFTNQWWEYDPALDQWTRKADFPGAARAGVPNFSIGNYGYVGSNTGAVPDFWMYDPVADKWTQKNDMPVAAALGVPGSFAIGGKGYTGAGTGSNQFWEYDPGTDGWTRKADYPGNAGASASYTAAFVLNNIGYLAGGGLECWSFNPVTNKWSEVAFMGYRLGGSAFAIGAKGYFAGGAAGGAVGIVRDAWEFSP